MDFFPISKDTCLVYNAAENPNGDERSRFLTYTLFTDNFSKGKYLDIFIGINKIPKLLFSPVWIDNKEILFVAPWKYYIYQLEGEKEKPRYKLNFGRYSCTDQELATLSSQELRAKIRDEKRVGCISGLFKSDRFLIFSCEFGFGSRTFLQSQKTKKVYCLNDCFEAGLLPECKIWDITDSGTLCGMVEPENLIKFQKLTGTRNEISVSDNDNPYMIEFLVDEF